MAVDSVLWWSVWWPWVVVFGVGLIALAVAVGSFVLAWRARHRFVVARKVPGFAIYLDKDTVENAHRLGGGVDDLIAKEVSRTVGVTKDGKLAIPGTSIDLGQASSSEIIETYVKKHEAIDVVGLLFNALDKAEDLLHVNLAERSVRRNAALEQIKSKRLTPAQLRALRTFVLVEGEFQYTGKGDGSRIYQAPIGESATDGPQVLVECEEEWLLGPKRTIKDGFDGVCLGRVLSWKGNELTIWPIAIFQ